MEGDEASDNAAERAPNPAPPEGHDGGWGWVVCAGSFVIHHNVLGLQYSFGVLFKVKFPCGIPKMHVTGEYECTT